MESTPTSGSQGGVLSCHRFVANQVRRALFVLACNHGNFLRRLALPEAVKDWSLRSLQVKLIKIGGRLVRHARRLVFQLAEVAVFRYVFQEVLDRIGRLGPAAGLRVFPVPIGGREGGPAGGVRLGQSARSNNPVGVGLLLG